MNAPEGNDEVLLVLFMRHSANDSLSEHGFNLVAAQEPFDQDDDRNDVLELDASSGDGSGCRRGRPEW